MPPTTPLSTIIALARAGALDHAWYQFRVAGYDSHDEDSAALTVKGRLLKDRAIRARGEERRRLYCESAAAYRRAAALQPGTYPLINAATLSLLSGDREQAEQIAREVLERIAAEPDEPETPYWKSATEAEALLLLGRVDEARAKLADAVAAAPRAWEDHGSTLRQFILIDEAIGADDAWLDLLRPPRSLSYSGHMVWPEAAGSADIAAAAAELIARDRIGFGFGSLAAGSDIAMAEALLASGAELHLVLASDAESFARRCVDPYGPDWRGRFDAALAAAETVHQLRPLQVAPDAAMLALADAVASGAAQLNAERLMTEARTLVVGDPDRASSSSAAQIIQAPAEARRLDLQSAEALPAQLISLMSIDVGSGGDPGFEDRLSGVREVLQDAAATIAPHLSGDEILVGFSGVAEAAEAARAIQGRLRGPVDLRIAGHYGFVGVVRDPFLDCLRPTEAGAAILKAIAQATPPDTVCVSLDFAAALAEASGMPGCACWIGELHAFDGGTPIPLYALRAADSDD